MSKIEMYNGNCVEVMDRLIEGGVQVDLTVTSPPYDNLRSYNGNNDSWSEDVWKKVIKNLYDITKDGGVVVWIVGDATIKGDETGTSFKQALYFKEVGFNLHDTMIYEKNGCGASGSNKCYIQNFEYMFVFSKGKISTFNLLYDRENKVVGKMTVNANRNKFTADNGRKYRDIETKKFGRRFNIWKYNQTSGHDKYSKSHPAPFPKHLAQDHILSWSKEGDLVLDPFMGSGTTGLCCKELNRNFIGVELDEKYFNISKERLGE